VAGARVIALDMDANRLAFCRDHLGVEFTAPAGETALDTVRDMTDGDLPTLVFDATGNPHSTNGSLQFLANNSRLVFVGHHPVPIALVGTGGMARRHLKGLATLYASGFRNLDLVAIYGRTPKKADTLADEAAALLGQRPQVFTDLAQMAQAGSVVGVSITTDTGSHHSVALACLQAGFHVLIEKPLALTIRGCTLVIDAARQRGRVLSVAENYRRDPMNRLARALLADGAIGTPGVMLESRIGGANKLFITPWRHQKMSGTVVFDTGVHNADILHYLIELVGYTGLFDYVEFMAGSRPMPCSRWKIRGGPSRPLTT
jgi:hypothetical protein